MAWWLLLGALVLVLVALAGYDLVQTRRAVLRNFPVIGHLRYLLEGIGPELRQYIVTSNDEERPFSRDQRRWIHASAARENPYFGFGTDSRLDEPGHVLFRHSAFPHTPGSESPRHPIPAAKVVGEWRGRPKAFRPASVVNTSAMSFGSLSAPAVEAMNRGAELAGCLQNTGEGGIADHHRHGGELIFQIGTGYFGCRDQAGRFSLERLVETVGSAPVRMIELKLSQGAKPGRGGVLPGAKVTPAIARARGVEVGVTVHSPNAHREFDDVDGLIDFVERIADATGLPVGIKSAVGDLGFWHDLAARIEARGEGPDFISIDGAEGGTGAAPLVFSDHVALPFRQAFTEVYSIFGRAGLAERITWIGAGKLGFPSEAVVAMALGVDLVAVGREAMLAIGCIQAQRCHNGHCPTGVATQNRWLVRGLDPGDKSVRLADYVISLRKEMLDVAHACGVAHPALVGGEAIEIVAGPNRSIPLWADAGYDRAWAPFTDPGARAAVTALMA